MRSSCNLAMILLTDLILADADIDWSVHMPQILHMATLGEGKSHYTS